MDIVYVENLPIGNDIEIAQAFKPFGQVKWVPVRKSSLLSGFCQFASPNHAAAFAEFIGKLPLDPPIKAVCRSNAVANTESITHLPINVLQKRVCGAINQFTGEIPASPPIELDGTLDTIVLTPEEKESLVESIKEFRSQTRIIAQRRVESRAERAAQVAALDPAQKKVEKVDTDDEYLSRAKILAAQYPSWETEWAEFKRLASDLKLKERALESKMKPAEDHNPEYYLNYEKEFTDEQIQAIRRQRVAEKELESEVVLEPVPIDELVLEYFGEKDQALIDFIKEIMPGGRDKLIAELGELLQEDTQAFVDKLLG